MQHAPCNMRHAPCIMHHRPQGFTRCAALAAAPAVAARHGCRCAARCRPAVETPPAIAVSPAAVPHCEHPAAVAEPFAAAARSSPWPARPTPMRPPPPLMPADSGVMTAGACTAAHASRPVCSTICSSSLPLRSGAWTAAAQSGIGVSGREPARSQGPLQSSGGIAAAGLLASTRSFGHTAATSSGGHAAQRLSHSMPIPQAHWPLYPSPPQPSYWPGP